jgi:opioid growth factor receptor-like protein
MSSAGGTRIVAFYQGSGTDHQGRRLDDILGFSLDELEYNHDYIQWLFPLAVPSGVLPQAPLVDEQCRHAFQGDQQLRSALRRALGKMLDFYGLSLDGPANAPRIDKARNFNDRSSNWLHPGNHNFLRLTRIMTSLELLGEPQLAVALQRCLEGLYREDPSRVGKTTIQYWRSAITHAAGTP